MIASTSDDYFKFSLAISIVMFFLTYYSAYSAFDISHVIQDVLKKRGTWMVPLLILLARSTNIFFLYWTTLLGTYSALQASVEVQQKKRKHWCPVFSGILCIFWVTVHSKLVFRRKVKFLSTCKWKPKLCLQITRENSVDSS